MIKRIILAIGLLATSANAQIMLTPYVSGQRLDGVLSENKVLIQKMLVAFNAAEKKNIQSFDYNKFDRALTTLHPTLVWATLKYLKSHSTGARLAHVDDYILHTQVLVNLAKSLTEDQHAQHAMKMFEDKTVQDADSLSNVKFMKLIDLIIEDLKSTEV